MPNDENRIIENMSHFYSKNKKLGNTLKLFESAIKNSNFKNLLNKVEDNPREELIRLVKLNVLLNVLKEKNKDPSQSISRFISSRSEYYLSIESLGLIENGDLLQEANINDKFSDLKNLWANFAVEADNNLLSTTDNTGKINEYIKKFKERNDEFKVEIDEFKSRIEGCPLSKALLDRSNNKDPQKELLGLIKLNQLLFALDADSKIYKNETSDQSIIDKKLKKFMDKTHKNYQDNFPLLKDLFKRLEDPDAPDYWNRIVKDITEPTPSLSTKNESPLTEMKPAVTTATIIQTNCSHSQNQKAPAMPTVIAATATAPARIPTPNTTANNSQNKDNVSKIRIMFLKATRIYASMQKSFPTAT